MRWMVCCAVFKRTTAQMEGLNACVTAMQPPDVHLEPKWLL